MADDLLMGYFPVTHQMCTSMEESLSQFGGFHSVCTLQTKPISEIHAILLTELLIILITVQLSA